MRGASTAVIYRSEDGGDEWSLVYEGPVCLSSLSCIGHIIVDLEFVDGRHGWAVGSIDIDEKVAIVHTDDGGRTWRPQPHGVDAAITEIDFLDRDLGFAVANLGFTLRTTDGGDSWEIVSRNPSILGNGLRALDFLDAQQGFGANAGGLIVRTLDGGVSWDFVGGGGGNHWDVRFADELNGWAAGDGVSAYTRDGGDTWQSSLHIANGGELRACVPIDGDSAFVVGNWGTINYTRDAGTTWQDVEGDGYITSADLSQVDFVNEDTGWAIGGRHGQIVHTRDGGETWVQQGGDPVWARYTALEFVNRQVGWVARGHEIWRTLDGGDRWELASELGSSVFDMWFVDEDRGWACGGDGSILVTNDGGLEWKAQDSGTSENLFSIDFFDGEVGWAVGARGTILHTVDGGGTWRQQRDDGALADLHDVNALDEKTAFALRRVGLLGTSDGGARWIGRAGGERWNTSLHFLDRYTGCVAGGFVGFGYLQCTEDGGRTWKECSVPDDRAADRLLGGIALPSRDVRYAVGERGTVLKFDRRDAPKLRFLRGDCNDDGNVDISDAVCILKWLFLRRSEPGCVAAANTNGDEAVDISDPVFLLGSLFLGKPPPMDPFPECGTSDLEGDRELGCEAPPRRCQQ